MSNVRDIKYKPVQVVLSSEADIGRVRHIKYDLNAFAEIEEHYGSVDKALEALQDGSIRALRLLLYAGLVHEDEELTPKAVGSLVSLKELKDLAPKLNEALMQAIPQDAEEGNLQDMQSQLSQAQSPTTAGTGGGSSTRAQ